MGGSLVNTPSMPVGSLTQDQVFWVLAAARAALSNSHRQLGLLCTDSGFEVRDITADGPSGDRGNRGDAMLHAGRLVLDVRVAIRALGIHPAVQLLPDADQDDLLAVIRPQGRSQPTREDLALAEVMPRLSATGEEEASTAPVAVTTSLLNRLRQAAKVEQAWLAVLAPAQVAVLPSLRQAGGRSQFGAPPIPADHRLTNGAATRATTRAATASSAGWTAVIGSLRDVPIARLQAGQALERVLLTAAGLGVLATVVPDIAVVPETRRALRELIGGGLWPQCVIRLGEPSLIDAVAGTHAGTDGSPGRDLRPWGGRPAGSENDQHAGSTVAGAHEGTTDF